MAFNQFVQQPHQHTCGLQQLQAWVIDTAFEDLHRVELGKSYDTQPETVRCYPIHRVRRAIESFGCGWPILAKSQQCAVCRQHWGLQRMDRLERDPVALEAFSAAVRNQLPGVFAALLCRDILKINRVADALHLGLDDRFLNDEFLVSLAASARHDVSWLMADNLELKRFLVPHYSSANVTQLVLPFNKILLAYDDQPASPNQRVFRVRVLDHRLIKNDDTSCSYRAVKTFNRYPQGDVRNLREWEGECERNIIIRELAIQKESRPIDRHCLKFHESHYFRHQFYFTMPYCFSSLDRYLRSREVTDATFPIKNMRNELRGLFEALSCLHNAKLCHQDIKPANIVIREDPAHAGRHGLRLLFCDFEHLVGQDKSSQLDEGPADPDWAAPRKRANEGWDWHTGNDNWAMGGVLLEFLTRVLKGREGLARLDESRQGDDGSRLWTMISVQRNGEWRSNCILKKTVHDYIERMQHEIENLSCPAHDERRTVASGLEMVRKILNPSLSRRISLEDILSSWSRRMELPVTFTQPSRHPPHSNMLLQTIQNVVHTTGSWDAIEGPLLVSEDQTRSMIHASTPRWLADFPTQTTIMIHNFLFTFDDDLAKKYDQDWRRHREAKKTISIAPHLGDNSSPGTHRFEMDESRVKDLFPALTGQFEHFSWSIFDSRVGESFPSVSFVDYRPEQQGELRKGNEIPDILKIAITDDGGDPFAVGSMSSLNLSAMQHATSRTQHSPSQKSNRRLMIWHRREQCDQITLLRLTTSEDGGSKIATERGKLLSPSPTIGSSSRGSSSAGLSPLPIEPSPRLGSPLDAMSSPSFRTSIDSRRSLSTTRALPTQVKIVPKDRHLQLVTLHSGGLKCHPGIPLDPKVLTEICNKAKPLRDGIFKQATHSPSSNPLNYCHRWTANCIILNLEEQNLASQFRSEWAKVERQIHRELNPSAFGSPATPRTPSST